MPEALQTEPKEERNTPPRLESAEKEFQNLIQDTIRGILYIQQSDSLENRAHEELKPAGTVERILRDRSFHFISVHQRDMGELISQIETADNPEELEEKMNFLTKNSGRNSQLVANFVLIERARFAEYFLYKQARQAIKDKKYLDFNGTSQNPLSALYVGLNRLLARSRELHEEFPDVGEFSDQAITDQIKDEVTRIDGESLEQNTVLTDVLMSIGANWSLDSGFRISKTEEKQDDLGKTDSL